MPNPNYNSKDYLSSFSDDAACCDALLNRARETVENEFALSREYAQKAHDLALLLKDKERQAKSVAAIGGAEIRLHLYDQALKNYQIAIVLYQELEDYGAWAYAKMMEGNVYLRQGKFLQALESQFQALPELLKSNLKLYASNCLMNIGSIYSLMGNCAEALDYYFQSLELIESYSEHIFDQSIIFLNIGDALARLKRFDESLIYSEKSLIIACENSYHRIRSVVLINLGEVHVKLGNYEKARSALIDGLDVSRKLLDPYEQARALNAFCQIYSQSGENQLLLESYEQALSIAREIKSSELEINVQLTFARHLQGTKQMSEAAAVAQDILKTSENFGLLAEVANAHELLFSIYKQQNEYKEALLHFEHYHRVKEKIYGEEQIKRTEALLIKQEMEKTRQIAEAQSRLNAELQAANEQIRLLLEQTEYRAAHDRLTGLPNRTLFEDRLEQTLVQAARKDETFAVLFLDLDGFKAVNDTLGHDAGDELLVQVAQRLKAVLRESDTIARQGGDEFTAIVNNLRKTEDVRSIALKLLRCFELKFDIFGHAVEIGVSIGISVYPDDGIDAQTLQKKADSAMYHVKQSGKKGLQFYSAVTNDLIAPKIPLEM